MNIKTIGSEPNCDLIFDKSEVAGLQARLELDEDGRVYLLDAGSDLSTFLNRNEQWIRVHKIRLCVADRIRFGQFELPLSTLVSAFGSGANIRLGDDNFNSRRRQSSASPKRSNVNVGVKLQRPRRNPLTGKIEQSDLSASQDN